MIFYFKLVYYVIFLILIVLGEIDAVVTSAGNLHLPIPMAFTSSSLLKVLDLKPVSS